MPRTSFAACNRTEKVEGITLYMQPVQDLTVEDRVSRTQYQYTLGDPDADELKPLDHALVAKLQALPELRDVATDQQTRQFANIWSSTASPPLAWASRRNRSMRPLRRLRPAAGLHPFTQLNQYHVVLETCRTSRKIRPN